ncbi:TraH [Klebsiella pneumoniae]|nr:TraH [Klebsiella pneumoniae]
MKYSTATALLTALMLITLQSQAGVNDDLNKFFNQMGGGGANVSMPAAWKGQAAGYMTGGNLFFADTSKKHSADICHPA